MKSPVVIVGGGLSGLYAARLLAAADRLSSHRGARAAGRADLVGRRRRQARDGFSRLRSRPLLVLAGHAADDGAAGRGIGADRVRATGAMAMSWSSGRRASRYSVLAVYGEMASSFRIAGGTAALVAALAAGLPKDERSLGPASHPRAIAGRRRRAAGARRRWRGYFDHAGRVIFALPPRLLESSVAFTPPLSPEIRARWRATPTWMAPHAKFLAVYEQAFWRGKGLSGMAQSMVGPCTEIHDASASAGGAALFGFLGRARRGAAKRRRGGAQGPLRRATGPAVRSRGGSSGRDLLQGLGGRSLDRDGGRPRCAAGHPERHRPCPGSIRPGRPAPLMAGSETASGHPGYLEGALEAAARAVASLAKAGAADEAM